MKISVVTVCYNSAATLAETVDSVARQSHREVEHIVIDGGSTDATHTILAERRNLISCLVSEPDGGIYPAMNKGLSRATGEFVGYLNADDFFAHADVLELIADAAASGVDAVYGDLVYVARHAPQRVVRRWRAGSFDADALRRGWMPPHPTFYVRTELLRQMQGFDERYRLASDYECMLRILRRRDVKIAYVDSVLVGMRSGGASNRSPGAMLRKSVEDLRAIRAHRLGGLVTLACKNLRKIEQFL